jgi:hypothetical protein
MADKNIEPPSRKLVVVFGDTSGILSRAIAELQSHQVIPEGFKVVNMDLAQCGQGAGVPFPEELSEDFLKGVTPWGRPSTVQ